MDDGKMKEKVEEMKNKAKVFLKTFSSPFGSARSTSSQTFKGRGHRLGGDAEPSGRIPSTSSNAIPTRTAGDTVSVPLKGGSVGRKSGAGCNRQEQQQSEVRRLQQEKWERERGAAPNSPCHLRETAPVTLCAPACRMHPRMMESGGTLSSAAASVKSSAPDDSLRVERESREMVHVGNLAPSHSISNFSGPGAPSHLDAYSPTIASGASHLHVVGRGGKFQCPICQRWWESEGQVSAHIDDCTVGEHSELAGLSIAQDEASTEGRQWEQDGNFAEDLDGAVAIFLSGGPSITTIQLIVRILHNILSAPHDGKFRKLRLENPKIKDSIGSAIGGLKFLESVGFRSVVEGKEKFSFMEQVGSEQKERMQAVITYFDSYISSKENPESISLLTPAVATDDPDSVNRQLRIFFPPRDNLEEKFELPESFYDLSVVEVKNEAAAARRKIEDSQMLIPKSFREKRVASARRQYKMTVVRVQLPDGLIVQGFFKSGEPTSSLYEFVASTLKDGNETFDLVLPAATKHRVIPRFPEATGHCLTMEEVDLVPKALLQFNPTGPFGYTCLKNEFYELCEPLRFSTCLQPWDSLKNLS